METKQKVMGQGAQYWVEGEGTTMVGKTNTKDRKFLKVNGREAVWSLQVWEESSIKSGKR